MLFSDTVLLPYLNSAYRKVRRGISMAGGPLFIMDDVMMVVPPVATADPSVQVIITDATSPQLPLDMLEPLNLSERPTGTNNNFMDMVDMSSHGGLPSQEQGLTLGMWEWRTDGIVFLGATVSTDVRMRYKRILLDVVDGEGQILIRDSEDCIAYLTAAMAAMARGSPLADKWATAGEDGLEALISAATRREQKTPRRRLPFSSKTGGYGSFNRGGW